MEIRRSFWARWMDKAQCPLEAKDRDEAQFLRKTMNNAQFPLLTMNRFKAQFLEKTMDKE
jgi:hypothetical protein